MRKLMLLIAVATLALAGCKKKSNEGAGSGTATASGSGSASGSGPASGSGSAMGSGAASGSGADTAMANKAGNCPSAVMGATTVIVEDADTAGKVALSITAKEETATATIRKRVAHLVDVQAAPDTDIKHSGEGTGGAAMGMCPVVTSKEAKISASDIDGGSRVVIEPTGALTLDALKKDVEGRIAKTNEWAASNIKATDASGGGGGVGGGKGDHGGNHSGKGDGKGKDEDKAGAGGDKPGSAKSADDQAGGNKM